MNERGADTATPVRRAQNPGQNVPSETPDMPDQGNVEPHDIQAAASDIVTAYGRRVHRAAASPSGGDAPTAPVYRMRDYAPEARGQSFSTTQGALASHASSTKQAPPPHPQATRLPLWAPPSNKDAAGELNYFTQAVPFVMPQPAPLPIAAAASPLTSSPLTAGLPASVQLPTVQLPKALLPTMKAPLARPTEPAGQRVLSRRELRELETRQGLRPQAEDGPAESTDAASREEPVQAAATTLPAPAKPLPEATAKPLPDATLTSSASAAPLSFTQALFATPPAPATLTAPAPSAPEAATTIFPVAPPAAPKLHPSLAAAERGVDLAPEVYTTLEQWATPTGLDGASAPSGSAFFRSPGTTTGSFTTNALVIPTMPQLTDLTRPFGSTGEILITGTIDLPHSLGTTGAHPARFDNSDIDALFAAEDNDYAASDSAPVRAIRAVSTHTSTHGVISAKMPANNKLPMMMAITAGALAVGVATLVAAGMIFGYF